MYKEKYKLIIKGSVFTIPKQNIRFLAMTKAQDLNKNICLDTNEQAVEFLESLGIEVQLCVE